MANASVCCGRLWFTIQQVILMPHLVPSNDVLSSFSSRSLVHWESSLSSSVPPLLPYSLVCNWTAVDHTFVFAVCRSGYLCSICSAVWSSRPQLQSGDGASFIFLNMWALSRLWPVRSLVTTNCCHRDHHDHSLLPPVKEVEVIPQCVTPGLLWRGSSFLGRWHCRLAVFLWLRVWRARLLFHFLKDHSGLEPTAGLLACAVRPREGFLQDKGVCLLL